MTVVEQQPGDGEERVARDATFHEAAMLDEIELFGELLIVAGSRSAPLSSVELDGVLGFGAA